MAGSLNKATIRVGWKSSGSIHTIKFEPKPVLGDISIVIPTLGRDILEQSLVHILVGSAWPGSLIVVEQGSNPKVAKMTKRMQEIGIHIKHIFSSQSGRSAGINRGLEQVDTRFVAITDDDCFVGKEWLSRMANRLGTNPEAVVTGRVEAAGEEMIIVVTSMKPAVHHRPRLRFDSMSGGNMGTSLEVFRKVGLFDEDPVMATAEDAEWSYRALRKNITIIYDPSVCLKHFGWRDQENRAEQYRHYALSHGGFFGKYLRKGDLFILARALVHFARAARRWMVGVLTGNGEIAMNGRAYCLGLFPGILAGFRSRTQINRLP